MPRTVDLGVTKYVWVEGDDGIADVNAPSAAAITAGDDISEFVVTTTQVGPTDSDVVNEKGITDTANVETPTTANYQGNLALFRDFTDGAPTVDVDLLAKFSGSKIGWLVRRVGKPFDVEIAVGDVVEVYKFRPDHPQISGGTGEGYLKMQVPLKQQGRFNTAATVVA